MPSPGGFTIFYVESDAPCMVPRLRQAEHRRAVDDDTIAGVDWTAQNTRHQEDQRAMNQGQYYVGKYRVDFGALVSPEVIANIEEIADVNGVILAPGMTWYDLMREYHGSYCACRVRRHPDGTFAVIEMCQDHVDQQQAEADERARTLLEE